MQEYQYTLYALVMLLAAFGSGCSFGMTFRTRNPKKKVSNARRR